MEHISYEKPFEKINKEYLFSLCTDNSIPNRGSYLEQRPLHWHQHIEIVYIEQGVATVQYNSEKLTVNEGNLLIVNSNVLHQVKSALEDKTVMIKVLAISTNLCNRYQLKLDNIYFEKTTNDPQLLSLLFQISNEFAQKQEDFHIIIHALIIQMLTLLKRNHTVSTSQVLNDTLIKQTLAYIHANFGNHISLETICQNIGFSKSQLCHTFKKSLNMSLFDYLNEYRCMQANQLLSSGNYYISTVAQLCGFNSSAYFSKVYYKYMKEFPSETIAKKLQTSPVAPKNTII